MNYCLIYIFLLFLISLVFLNLVRYHNDKKIEGMVNILDITLKELEDEKNKIDLEINKNKKESGLELNDIVDSDLVNNYTISDNIGQEYFKSKFKKYDVPLKNITRQGTEKYNRQMLYDEKYPDYAPYENILPIFKKDHKIRGKNKKYYSKESISNEIYETGRIKGLPKVNTTDCQGKWNDWDETHCIPNNRCSLRFRTYNVTREAKLDGDQCKYDGEEVFDGDIDYDFCYGNNNKDRCGINQKNVCECDIDNFDSEKCNFDESNDECICPDGYKLKSGSGTDIGKCITDADAAAALAAANESKFSIDEIRALRLFMSNRGTVEETVEETVGETVGGTDVYGLLRLARGNQILEAEEAILAELQALRDEQLLVTEALIKDEEELIHEITLKGEEEEQEQEQSVQPGGQ